ncbi:class F sortase [Actinoplanes sp. URMC 104]|uniref:class F sortase n=1 Tax=Actinoplanes sp. URMC 104 TaxID=3423409 RepID=UPI003F1CF400
MRMRAAGYRIAAAAVVTATAATVVSVRAAPPPEAPRELIARTAASAPTGSPADLAVRFEALLGQHAVLASNMMRSRVRGDDDFVQAANASLGQNTADMTALVGRLFGAPTAEKFRPLWSRHVVALFAYAGALAEQDDAAEARARAQLTTFEGDLAQFFAGGSQGRLPVATARTLVVTHVEHLTGQADAYAAGDYARSDQQFRQGFQHTYDLGLGLAKALLPASDTAELQEPVWRLRSQLGKLLAEHAVLIEDTTRAAVTRTPDFTASGRMLNANTSDLAAAIDTLFGAPAAKKFQQLWGTHVEALVGYASAAAAQDQAAKQRSEQQLATFQRTMAQFLSGATGGRSTPAAIEAALSQHDRMLVQHADAYADKNYKSAHDIAYETYDHMFDLARTLADAFGAAVAARLPRGGAQTGYGGMAFSSSTSYATVAPPVRLRIPALRVDSRLVGLGQRADGSIAVPADAAVPGWYARGPRPGQPGPAVLLGHVDSRDGPGVFFGLAGLSPGALVEVGRADGSTAGFRVTRVSRVAKSSFPTDLVYAPTLDPALRLVTCGGSFDHARGSYRDNVIVYAEAV